jgi:hypothetical protein
MSERIQRSYDWAGNCVLLAYAVLAWIGTFLILWGIP